MDINLYIVLTFVCLFLVAFLNWFPMEFISFSCDPAHWAWIKTVQWIYILQNPDFNPLISPRRLCLQFPGSYLWRLVLGGSMGQAVLFSSIDSSVWWERIVHCHTFTTVLLQPVRIILAISGLMFVEFIYFV